MTELAIPNKGRIRLLVAALRSGLYLQGNGYLHRMDINENPPEGILPGAFCCLEVAADVAMRFGLAFDRRPESGGFLCEVFDTSPSYMSPRVAEWYGFPAVDTLTGAYDVMLTMPDGYTVRAAIWNDSGSTFEDIAKGFERTFLS